MAFRDAPFENIKVPLVWTAAVAVLAALVVAVLMLMGSGQNDGKNDPARATFETGMSPVASVLSTPGRWIGSIIDHVGGYFGAVSENRRLKARVAELEAWREDAIAMRDVNERYAAMLGIRTDPALEMVTARAISESRGPFANARLLDAGAGRGVKVGYPVVNEHGLVGRVVGVGAGVSRMLLLTDVASRTPVLIDRTDARAFLSGDGGDNPKLEFVRGDNAVQAGDRVLTSGDGGLFPRGLPVGVVARGLDGNWRVRLYSDRGAVDYVRVLRYDSFAAQAAPGSLEAAPLSAFPPPPAAASASAPAPAAGAAR